jgi:hypothetical protein
MEWTAPMVQKNPRSGSNFLRDGNRKRDEYRLTNLFMELLNELSLATYTISKIPYQAKLAILNYREDNNL